MIAFVYMIAHIDLFYIEQDKYYLGLVRAMKFDLAATIILFLVWLVLVNV